MEGRTVCPMEDQFAPYELVENLVGGAFWSCNLAVRRTCFEAWGDSMRILQRPALRTWNWDGE